ncbi:MAG: nicotinate-nucleotide adenylyltransferase [Chloroflexi bacterium]|nr:nicotinate-nucleotide adenylyltransferase [Chloroflexota bacterium]
MRIGVFGGTFDPPHLGHLAAAQEACSVARLERVLFVPAGRNPLKPRAPASTVEHRLAMTELAVADNPAFVVSRVDADRAGPSYSVDLLERLRAEQGPGCQLAFIVGMDVLHELHRWHRPERLLELASLVAVTRPGQSALEAGDLEARLPGATGRITVVRTAGVAISSRELRARVRTGRPIRYLVPDPVAAYIAEHRLYL